MSENEAVDNGKTSPSASEAAETDSKTSSNTESGQASSSSSAKQDASKVDILLKPAGDAPIMKKKKWQVGRTKKISWVSTFIRNYIKSEQSESLFLYVNQSFAPSPDTDIGSIFDCFGSDGKLVLHYCRTQAWG